MPEAGQAIATGRAQSSPCASTTSTATRTTTATRRRSAPGAPAPARASHNPGAGGVTGAGAGPHTRAEDAVSGEVLVRGCAGLCRGCNGMGVWPLLLQVRRRAAAASRRCGWRGWRPCVCCALPCCWAGPSTCATLCFATSRCLSRPPTCACWTCRSPRPGARYAGARPATA